MSKGKTAEKQLSDFWAQFNSIAEANSVIGLEIYRGESKEYDVPSNPSLFRNVEDQKYGGNISWQSIEERMLSEFKRKAFSCFKDTQSIPNSQLEWRALAQHYGLPTRLIDWTTNPMVALYFAVEKNDEEDGVLYWHNDIELVEYELDDQITFQKGEMYIGSNRYQPHQQTGKPLSLHSAALVNRPGLDGLNAVALRSLHLSHPDSSQQEDSPMDRKQLIAELGLADDATDEQIYASLKQLNARYLSCSEAVDLPKSPRTSVPIYDQAG